MPNILSVPASPEAQKLMEIIDERITNDDFCDMQEDVDSLWKQIMDMPRGEEKNSLIELVKDLGNSVNDYRDTTAGYAAQLAELRPLDQWEHDHIGKSVLMGDYVNSGTVAEWLAGRKTGFGGSDIGHC